MNSERLIIRELAVTDGNLPAATVTFASGLNLVVGASDTGKTFIFEAIDFMLGAKGPLRRIPQAGGYVDVSLAIDASSGVPFTLRRGFTGGEFALVEFGKGRSSAATTRRVLSAVHSDDPSRSLSAYLLRAIGLLGKQVRKNASGAKESLSFRHVRHLTLIDEERIIQQASPVTTGRSTTRTADENAFAFFLSGVDDSSVISGETKQQRDARLSVEQDVIMSLLEGTRQELNAFQLGAVNSTDEATRLDAAIERATTSVVTSQADIEDRQRRRENTIAQRAGHRSRLAFVADQVSRLRLLRDYYDTDYARLATAIEASQAFHVLPEGICPFCNRPFDADAVTTGHEQFRSACLAEMAKIGSLRRDLDLAIHDFDSEIKVLGDKMADLNLALATVDEDLQRILAPAATTNRNSLEALMQRRTTVAQAITLQTTADGLEHRLATLEMQQLARPTKLAFEKRATTGSTTEFCQVVEEILAAWKYPNLGRVTFDPDKGDIVIGGQDRANKGKGYRAITYAAFVIALMRVLPFSRCATSWVCCPRHSTKSVQGTHISNS